MAFKDILKGFQKGDDVSYEELQPGEYDKAEAEFWGRDKVTTPEFIPQGNDTPIGENVDFGEVSETGAQSVGLDESLGPIVMNIVPSVAPVVGNVSRSAGLTYPTTLANVSLNPAHINFQFYTRPDENASLANIRSTSINLPMPDNISNPSTINWDQENFGMVGDAMTKGLQEIQKNGGNISAETVQEKLDSMAERIKSLAFYTGMSNAVGLVGGQASAEGIMGQVSGKIPNPYKTFLFKGVDFRTFTFEFNLVPFTESDCDLIYKIIQKFREHSYPDFAADKMFFTYPDECQITYMWESGANKWLNNFKRAVCTGIDVNFAPMSQWSSHRNGFPDMVKISTRWTETEIVTKGDIANKNLRGQRS